MYTISNEQADKISRLITATIQLNLLEDKQRENGYNHDRGALIKDKRDQVADLAIQLEPLATSITHSIVLKTLEVHK